MVTTPDLSKATDFVWRTARLLERHRFAFLFLGGEREKVLEALRPYQNADGGFGNGLEPDVRAPLSQPVPTWTALCILDEAGAFADPMVTQACEYLRSITTAEGGVPSLSSIDFWERKVKKERQDAAICYDEKTTDSSKAGERICLARIDYRNGHKKCQWPLPI